MRRLRSSLAVLGVLLALAVVLNPSPDRHRAKLRAAVAERSPIAGALGIGAAFAFASSYHSLGVASYTTVGGRTATVGAFGLVFALDATRQR
jgi:hypothetical protein